MAGSHFPLRIVGLVLMVTGFAASCSQMLGDFEVVGTDELVNVDPNLPSGDAGSQGPPPVERICEEGLTRCEGELLQLCTDGGTAWVTLEVCGSPALCQASGLSTVSGCADPECAKDEMSCDGATLRLCNADRNGWDVFDTCETAGHCNAGNRKCDPAPCAVGERRCNVGQLERCRDDQLDWELLDSCATNELCLATIEQAREVALANDTGELAAAEAAGEAIVFDVSACMPPQCVTGEVNCDGAQLLICNEGRTAFESLELCATSVLCDATLTYVGLGGRPRCRQPVCGVGEHQCTPNGILQVCTEGREGYTTIETCIGPPFCNAVAADNGLPGCEDAPCEAGETQCNGAQRQRCLDDRTGFEPLGAPCETRDLCNDEQPNNAICEPPVCQRGQFSGTEFRCVGATLQRCNDQHTGYDVLNTCASAGLCNAALGFNGCVAPVCSPGQTRCNGDFLQICNGQRTGFDNVERCAAGTCDSTAGRCADPCVVGSARCNAQGELEECRDRLIGREITARCGSPQLCDAATRSCRQPPAGCTADGVRRCRVQGADTILEVCSDGRSRFTPLDTCGPGEFCDINNQRCDVCDQRSQATCQGNNLVTCAADGQSQVVTPCAQGCESVPNGPDRCRNCVVGSATCEGRQLVVCEQGAAGEVLDRDNCETPGLCQAALADCNPASGEPCQCQDSVCDPTDLRCNGRQPERCNANQTGFEPNGPSCTATLCDPETASCDLCLSGDKRCAANGTMEGCSTDGSRFEPILRPGTALCLSPTGPAQTCPNGAGPVTTTACASGICLDGVGCVECDANRFTPECVSNGSGGFGRTQCVAGEEVTVPCSNQSGACFVTTCDDRNGCGVRPRCNTPELPVCIDGTCVECATSGDCSGGEVCVNNSCVQCAADQCSNGLLRRCASGALSAPTACPFPSVCNAQGTACRACDAALDCSPPDACTPARCGANGCVTASSCTGGQICDNTSGRCITPVRCGDGTCSADESTRDCPQDCGTFCGDGACNSSGRNNGAETTANCPVDCGSECGDGVANGNEECDELDLGGEPPCGANETGTISCTPNCEIVRVCTPVLRCGDGIVSAGEDCDGQQGVPATCGNRQLGRPVCNPTTCTLDRSGCVDSCGNGQVDPGEQCDGAAGVPTCGNNQVGEVRCVDCTIDRSGCSAAPPPPPPPPPPPDPAGSCGNGVCNPQEDAATCPQDCGSSCGDGVVSGNEECDPPGISVDCPPGSLLGLIQCSDECTVELDLCL